MKLARFSVDNWESYGLVEGDRVRVIQGNIFGEHRMTGASYPLERVKFLPPTQPTSYWAVGLNYAAHIAHQEQALDAERIRRESAVFRPWHKGVGCLIGQDDPIALPPEADYIHYEGELLIVIGRPARRVTPGKRLTSSWGTPAATMSAVRVPGPGIYPTGGAKGVKPLARWGRGLKLMWIPTNWI